MKLLIKESGQEIREPQQILYKQYKFYEKLYTSEDTEPFTYKNNQDFNIPEALIESLNSEFTIKDIREAIKGLSKNKACGVDGLTAEFYIMFCTRLEKPLMDAINFAITNGQLHESAVRGVINLITKRDKDNRILRNLRPMY